MSEAERDQRDRELADEVRRLRDELNARLEECAAHGLFVMTGSGTGIDVRLTRAIPGANYFNAVILDYASDEATS